MDPQNNLANLTALLNIVCNGIEVLGIAAGIPYLALSWIPMACGAKGYTSKMYLACVGAIVIALITPVIVNGLMSMAGGANRSLFIGFGIVVGLVLAFVTLGLCFALALAPIIMAMREKLPSKGLIIGLNVGSFLLPILWIPSLIVASLAVTKKHTAPIVQLIKEQRNEIN
ncbi:hypothetical protein BH11CYA1_BH11CYA1_27420 [soil metagenome]